MICGNNGCKSDVIQTGVVTEQRKIEGSNILYSETFQVFKCESCNETYKLTVKIVTKKLGEFNES